MSILDENFEDRTVFEVTTNEGSFTLFVLGLGCIFLSVMYLIITFWYKVKYQFLRR